MKEKNWFRNTSLSGCIYSTASGLKNLIYFTGQLGRHEIQVQLQCGICEAAVNDGQSGNDLPLFWRVDCTVGKIIGSLFYGWYSLLTGMGLLSRPGNG